jgi:hypothetical protein
MPVQRLVPTRSTCAIRRMLTASAPSASATAMAASTISARDGASEFSQVQDTAVSADLQPDQFCWAL